MKGSSITYCTCYAAIKLVKMRKGSAPVTRTRSSATFMDRHDPKDVHVISMYRGSNQKGSTWVETQSRYWTRMSPKL